MNGRFVVIPAFNGMDLLRSCIRSVINSDGNWTPVVVDNASTDGTNQGDVEALGAVYIQNDRNYGFGRACNIGLSYALQQNASHVAILNQDACVKRNSLQLLVETLSNRPDAAIACPLVVKSDGSLYQEFANWIVHQNKRVLEDGLVGVVSTEYTVSFLNAACWVLNVDVLHKIGGFDPIFFMYFEDKEYAARCAHHGYSMALNTQAKVVHDKSLRAEVNSLKRKLYWASVRPTSNLLGGMRNYGRPYWRNLPGAVRGWVGGFTANLLSGSPIATTGYVIALFRFLSLYARNAKNHALSRNGVGDLFLD